MRRRSRAVYAEIGGAPASSAGVRNRDAESRGELIDVVAVAREEPPDFRVGAQGPGVLFQHGAGVGGRVEADAGSSDASSERGVLLQSGLDGGEMSIHERAERR